MVIHGRNVKFSQFAKAASVLAGAFSLLSIRALFRGFLFAYEFSVRACELYHELAEDDPIPVITLSQLSANLLKGREIWVDLSPPPPQSWIRESPSTALRPESSLPDSPSPFPAFRLGVSAGELSYLCSLAKAQNPRVVVEIGTYRGFTTLHLSRNTPDSCRIFTVDLPPELAKGTATVLRAYGNDPKITQILQDSATIQWEHFLSTPIDFAFVDGGHLYEEIRKDTEGVMKALAPNGLVVWHDYRPVEVRWGVKKYLNELYRNGLPLWRIAGTTLCVYARGLLANNLPIQQSHDQALEEAGRR